MIKVLPNTRVKFSRAVLGATAGVVPLYLLSRLKLNIRARSLTFQL